MMMVVCGGDEQLNIHISLILSLVKYLFLYP